MDIWPPFAVDHKGSGKENIQILNNKKNKANLNKRKNQINNNKKQIIYNWKLQSVYKWLWMMASESRIIIINNLS